MDTAKQRMAAWLNVDAEEVHFGPSTSLNTYVLAQALRQKLKPGDEVIVTDQDHEAADGNTVTVDALYPSTHTSWGRGFNADDITLSDWGTFTLTWTDCNAMTFEYTSSV